MDVMCTYFLLFLFFFFFFFHYQLSILLRILKEIKELEMNSQRDQQQRAHPQLKEKFSRAATTLAELYKESTHAYEEGYRDALRTMRSFIRSTSTASRSSAGTGQPGAQARPIEADALLRYMDSLQFERRELHRAARGSAKHPRCEDSEERDHNNGDTLSSESECERRAEAPQARTTEEEADVHISTSGIVQEREAVYPPARRRRRLHAPREHQCLSLFLEE